MCKRMIEYIVEVTVEQQYVVDWVDWMLHEHIPDVMSTGLFLKNTFFQHTSLNNVFVITYQCKCLKIFRDYQSNFAKETQLKHSKLFGKVTTANRRIQIVTNVD